MEESLNSKAEILSSACRRLSDLKLLGVAVLLNGLLFGLVLVVGTPAYKTDDDVDPTPDYENVLTD